MSDLARLLRLVEEERTARFRRDRAAPVYPTAIHSDGEAPIPLSAAMLDAVRTWSRNDRLWGSRSATEFNLCAFARVILKADAEGK